MKKITIALLTLFLTVFAHNAYAWSCAKPRASLDEMYVQSDIVFTGVVKEYVDNKDKNIASGHKFDVTHTYKAPEGIDISAELVQAGWASLKQGKEYLVFGSVKSFSDGSYVIESGPCGRTQMTADQWLKDVKAAVESSDEGDKKLLEHFDVLFIGDVIATDNKTRIQKNKSGEIKLKISETNVIFDVEKVLFQRPKGELPDNEQIEVFSSMCERHYDLWGKYIVGARYSSRRKFLDDGTVGRESVLNAGCVPIELFRVDLDAAFKRYDR